MIERDITEQVLRALKRQAAVALVGPRQVGKTTLALAIAEQHNAVYLDLEDRDDRQRLENAVLFFDSVEDRLVILDEIHQAPELFKTLRGVIDRGKRKQKGKGRFLILGSASLDLLRQEVVRPSTSGSTLRRLSAPRTALKQVRHRAREVAEVDKRPPSREDR